MSNDGRSAKLAFVAVANVGRRRGAEMWDVLNSEGPRTVLEP